jgi:hypothetical protein
MIAQKTGDEQYRTMHRRSASSQRHGSHTGGLPLGS